MTFTEWLALIRFGMQILSAAAIVVAPVFAVGFACMRFVEKRQGR